jgi:murein DD-endopeptidase MepM/ murein hydrolase activator NlpD
VRNVTTRGWLAVTLAALLSVPAGAASYQVQPGENLSVIAARLGLGLGALRAANPALRDPDQLRAGTRLALPRQVRPATRYRVRAGQNLSVIASGLGLTVGQLLRANPGLTPDAALWVGRLLNVPARRVEAQSSQARVGQKQVGQKQAARPVRVPQTASLQRASVDAASRTGWLWPLAGPISSGFGGRSLEGQQETHYGVDIVAPVGALVRVARAGRVLESRADYARGWGWTVIVDHGDGWHTRYAHLSANLTRAREWVVRGQPIGRVGDTGRSTGPHLHYGTYLNGVPRDPETLR